ncbi:MAG: TPM domain-containing protein [Oscillospiraceae bacterium]
MKKIISFLIISVIMVFMKSGTVYADEISRISDISGRLPDIEINRLDEILDDTSEKTGFNTAVVITDNLNGKNASEYAEDFFNDNYKDYPNSIILLINYDTNNDIIYPTGTAERYYTDDIQKKVLSENIENYIAQGHISEAVTAFAENSVEIFSMELPEQNESTEVPKEEKSENYILFLVIFGVLSGVIVGIILGVYIKNLYKRPDCEFAVSNYQCRHKIAFDVKEDKFRREYVSKGEFPQ